LFVVVGGDVIGPLVLAGRIAGWPGWAHVSPSLVRLGEPVLPVTENECVGVTVVEHVSGGVEGVSVSVAASA
jgi:hypothetical protein